MVDLQSCFFCGTAEDVQEYAVVPPRYTDDGDPQVAVLCAQCKPKLLQVIEPLVNRLEGDGTDTAAAGEPSATAEQLTTQDSGGEGITMSPDSPAETPEKTGGEIVSEEDDTESETATGPGSVTPSSEQPPNYRRAMRMLSNREFPLDRTEVESMLAGAYDMENHELEAVLDHAVEAGDLREEDGQFWDGE